MINTAAFEALTRLKTLVEARDFASGSTYTAWMEVYLNRAIRAEGEFIQLNRVRWDEELRKIRSEEPSS